MNELSEKEKNIRDQRIEKISKLKQLGYDPYKEEKYDFTHTIKIFLTTFEENKYVKLTGRIVGLRLMGKTAFVHLNDGTSKVQLYFKKDAIGEKLWEVFNLLDLGDHIGIEGSSFITKTGEKSVYIKEFKPLSKCLHILPIAKEKDGQEWYGLTDTEHRYRNRHLDLVCNKVVREKLIKRMKVISAVRRYLDSLGYLEVETPFLQLVAGGAAAKPFKTHYNAYNLDVKLRISLELYLKRLICGDIPKVYEIGRVFRNEGVSNRHNPEFTMLEFYEAYINLEDMMKIVEEMFLYVSKEVFGSPIVETKNVIIDFSQPWKRIDLLEELELVTAIKKEELKTLDSARKAMHKVGLPIEKEHNLGGIIEKLLEHFIEPSLIQPSFIIGYPVETSPLAKGDPDRPGFTRRFEGYIHGREICNAFSELNDPIIQRQRFEEQAIELSKGNEEAHPMDQEFLYAMECGMPPTGGCGIGLDRMAMILSGAESIREVLLFPMMKPE